MTIIQALILGIVEGLTEFLPISSTAHLLITGDILKIADTEFLKTFSIAIQFGAILSVLVLYWKRVWSNTTIILKLAVAFIPTSIIGFIFYKIIKNYLMESLPVIAISLVIGGLIIIWFENWLKHKKTSDEPNDGNLDKISYRQSFILGIAQAIAVIPGVSRSAATIIGGLAQGIKRKAIVEFSFLLAIPTMLAATVYDLYKNSELLNIERLDLWIIGFTVSFITAIIAIKFLLKYIEKKDFKIFAWYRIILGLIIISALFI